MVPASFFPHPTTFQCRGQSDAAELTAGFSGAASVAYGDAASAITPMARPLPRAAVHGHYPRGTIFPCFASISGVAGFSFQRGWIFCRGQLHSYSAAVLASTLMVGIAVFHRHLRRCWFTDAAESSSAARDMFWGGHRCCVSRCLCDRRSLDLHVVPAGLGHVSHDTLPPRKQLRRLDV